MGPKEIRSGPRTAFYLRDEIILFGSATGLHQLAAGEVAPDPAGRTYRWQKLVEKSAN